MIEFIDKTSEQNGTPINRDKLMALQGFGDAIIVFTPNGVIETNGLGQTRTISEEAGRVVEVFEGEKTITKVTSFLTDGSIVQEVM